MYNSDPQDKIFDIRERTFKFGVRIIKLISALPKTTASYAIGNQLIRSGTSIGANTEEAQNAGSKKDFIHCLTISLKEARETEYWLRMISETGIISQSRLKDLLEENKEIIKILTTIIKKTKENCLKQ